MPELAIDNPELSNQVKNEIRSFVYANINDWKSIALDNGGEWCDQYLELTIACSYSAERWNFQTGDNSFMGNCYSFPHWAIDTIDCDSSASGLSANIIDQLNELLAQ